MNNYPPGVSGNEPEITGIYRCFNCNVVLPEETECPRCEGTGFELYSEDGEICTECDGDQVIGFEGDECPDGCNEPDPDRQHDDAL